MDAGKEAQAQEELQKILHADPQSVDARVQLGFLYSRLKRLDEAIALLKEAVNLEPRRPELFLYLGTAYYRAQQYEDRKSTRLNSSHANISYAVFCLKKKKKRKN